MPADHSPVSDVAERRNTLSNGVDMVKAPVEQAEVALVTLARFVSAIIPARERVHAVEMILALYVILPLAVTTVLGGDVYEASVA